MRRGCVNAHTGCGESGYKSGSRRGRPIVRGGLPEEVRMTSVATKGSSEVRGRVRDAQSGQSLIESCIVIAVLCLVLFGVFQVSLLYAAKETLTYAANRGLRAKAVGFNQFMVFKTVRVGAIPSAGPMTTPQFSAGPAEEGNLERPRIPMYLGARNWSELDAILNYDRWDSLDSSPPFVAPGGILHMAVRQKYPLNIAFHEAFYADSSVPIKGEADLDNHYTLYMNDEGL